MVPEGDRLLCHGRLQKVHRRLIFTSAREWAAPKKGHINPALPSMDSNGNAQRTELKASTPSIHWGLALLLVACPVATTPALLPMEKLAAYMHSSLMAAQIRYCRASRVTFMSCAMHEKDTNADAWSDPLYLCPRGCRRSHVLRRNWHHVSQKVGVDGMQWVRSGRSLSFLPGSAYEIHCSLKFQEQVEPLISLPKLGRAGIRMLRLGDAYPATARASH